VDLVERTNLRHIDPDAAAPYDAVVADLSFISLRTVMDVLVRSTAPGGWLVLLVKPQFEAGRVEVAKGRGVITDPVVWERVLQEVLDEASDAGAVLEGVLPSPLRGADGNTEFLIRLLRPADASESTAESTAESMASRSAADMIRRAVAEAGDTAGSVR